MKRVKLGSYVHVARLRVYTTKSIVDKTACLFHHFLKAFQQHSLLLLFKTRLSFPLEAIAM